MKMIKQWLEKMGLRIPEAAVLERLGLDGFQYSLPVLHTFRPGELRGLRDVEAVLFGLRSVLLTGYVWWVPKQSSPLDVQLRWWWQGGTSSVVGNVRIPVPLYDEASVRCYIRAVRQAWQIQDRQSGSTRIYWQPLRRFLTLCAPMSDQLKQEFVSLFPKRFSRDAGLLVGLVDAENRSDLMEVKLSLPWISKASRYRATYSASWDSMDYGYVQLLSAEAVLKRVLALPRNKGNRVWLYHIHSYAAIVDDPVLLLPVLPTIQDEEWFAAVQTMISRREDVDRLQKQALTLVDTPSEHLPGFTGLLVKRQY